MFVNQFYLLPVSLQRIQLWTRKFFPSIVSTGLEALPLAKIIEVGNVTFTSTRENLSRGSRYFLIGQLMIFLVRLLFLFGILFYFIRH